MVGIEQLGPVESPTIVGLFKLGRGMTVSVIVMNLPGTNEPISLSPMKGVAT